VGRIGGLNDETSRIMNLDSIKEFFGNLSARDLPTGAAALTGIVLLFFLFKTGKFFMKLMLFLIALGLFAGAYWWHTHK
jgi:hypothetical protein